MKSDKSNYNWKSTKHSWVFEQKNIAAYYGLKDIAENLTKILKQAVSIDDSVDQKTKISELDYQKNLKTTSQYYGLSLHDFVIRNIKPYRIIQYE